MQDVGTWYMLLNNERQKSKYLNLTFYLNGDDDVANFVILFIDYYLYSITQSEIVVH